MSLIHQHDRYNPTHTRPPPPSTIFAQLTSQMNVEAADLQAPQPRTGFLNSNVDVPFYNIDKSWTFTGFNSSVFKMEICAKFVNFTLYNFTLFYYVSLYLIFKLYFNLVDLI